MSWLTATSWVPSGTTILASTPSSMDSYSIVALSVSISASTSPALTLSPSFLSHLARLPFSIVGDSAGIRILIGMTCSRASTDCAGGAGIARRIHLGVVDRADALDHLVFAQRAFFGIDARDVARHVRDQHAPGLGVVEGAPQRHVQRTIDDDRAQDLDPALIKRRRRNMQRVEDWRRIVRLHGAHR